MILWKPYTLAWGIAIFERLALVHRAVPGMGMSTWEEFDPSNPVSFAQYWASLFLCCQTSCTWRMEMPPRNVHRKEKVYCFIGRWSKPGIGSRLSILSPLHMQEPDTSYRDKGDLSQTKNTSMPLSDFVPRGGRVHFRQLSHVLPYQLLSSMMMGYSPY